MSDFIPGHFGDYPPPLGEGLNHLEHPQDPEQTNLVISEMLQVAFNMILATLYFVIILLFCFTIDCVPDPLNHTLQTLGEDSEEPSHPEQLQGLGETYIMGMQQVVITAIHATDLTLGLQRIPAGFHVIVKTDGAEFQTSNKPVHIDQAVVEWNEPMLLYVALNHIFPAGIKKDSRPCKITSKVQVSIYASFELGAMLCHGEVLCTFEISIRELLDHNEKLHRQTQNSTDLNQCIKHFERAMGLCPMDHPYRHAVLFNLATAKFVSCQADRRYLNLDIPITLFQDTLDLLPTGHPDRPVTQLHLAISLLSRFAKQGFQTDADTAEELLNEVLDVCHADSHVYRAALLAMETSALHPAGNTNTSDLG
ncbi:hypothetical protein F4604DRAFT_1930578 [Suillus subluteus]|nr:hypothetical protein F4604DRAFT_1930578 [Suillus subluteus]